MSLLMTISRAPSTVGPPPCCVLVALALGVSPSAPQAAEEAAAYPSRAVTIVVGFAPGGATDLTARLLAGRLSQSFGQPFIVLNRPGSDSNTATEQVVRAKPDGHTLLMQTVANVTNMAANKHLNVDTVRDLSPIVQILSSPSILVVTPSLAVKDLRSLIALAKSQPGKLSFASSGTWGSTHMAGELFKMRAGLNIVHVPYKGAAPAMADVVAGHVSMGFMATLGALGQIQAGALRPLAVAHTSRLPDLPDVPTMAEAGMADFEVSSWNGLAAPVGTPPAIIERLNAETNRILAMADVQREIKALGGQVVGGTARQFSDHVRAQLQKWRGVVQAAGLSLE